MMSRASRNTSMWIQLHQPELLRLVLEGTKIVPKRTGERKLLKSSLRKRDLWGITEIRRSLEPLLDLIMSWLFIGLVSSYLKQNIHITFHLSLFILFQLPCNWHQTELYAWVHYWLFFHSKMLFMMIKVFSKEYIHIILAEALLTL